MSNGLELAQIAEAVRQRQRFVVSSPLASRWRLHRFADGVRLRGTRPRQVGDDREPRCGASTLMAFPVSPTSRLPTRCRGRATPPSSWSGDLARPGVAGLDNYFPINIDHHPGNTGYGAINWFDSSAAACGEMVFDLVRELGVPLTLDIATHIYLAILTDTGSFHYSSISPRTFDICRQLLEAGVDPVSRRTQRLRQQQHGSPEAVRRRAQRHAARSVRTHRHHLSRSRDGTRRAAPTTTLTDSSTCR